MRLRQAWHTEARLNKWLGETAQLDRLSKFAGCKLELLQLEATLNHGRVDLLCADAGTGSTVVIESKLGLADLDHFGRLLCYAEEFTAKAGIYVAENFPQQIIDTSKDMPFAIHLIKASVGKLDDNSMFCVLSSVYSPKARKRQGAVPQLCSLVAPAVSSKIKEALGELIRSARQAKLLSNASIVVGQGSIPQFPKSAKTALLVMWPSQPGYADLAETMSLLQRNKAAVLIVLMRSTDQAAADKLASLAKIAGDVFVHVLTLQPHKSNWKLLPSNPSELGADPKGKSFWLRVAGNLSKRSLQVQAVSGQGVFVATSSPQIRMVAFHQARPKRLCVELRLGGENQFVAESKFSQIKEQEVDISGKLAEQFEIQWHSSKVRANDHVLRLVWKRREFGQPEEFSWAIAKAHQALLVPVASLEDFDW